MFLQHLHQARFANTGFAAEQHYLSETVLDVCPTLQQEPHFLLPAHERVNPVLPAASRRLRAMLS